MKHIFLTGFMGAGKTSAGKLVAESLGVPFVDLDAAIEATCSSSVSEIFAERGEAAFRELEHEALQEVSLRDPAVVATGGGIVLREDNRAILERSGTVIYLAVTPEEAIARLGDADDRPLLSGGGLDAARKILSDRIALYAASADHVVDTTGLDAGDAASRVIAAVKADQSLQTVHVGRGEDVYDVAIGRGLMSDVPLMVRKVTGATNVAIVSDEHVWALFGDRLTSGFSRLGVTSTAHVIPAGEQSKSWDVSGRLLERFAESGLDRGSVVVALGGGVVGDLAGFCASAYMRGIQLVQVPTTLLAQVDSSIGGKTAVDLAAGKNLAGAFWPPKLVVADADALGSLPGAEWTNGLVETVKAALLEGGDALLHLEENVDRIVARQGEAVSTAITYAAGFKARVVTDDLRESALRECLNLGHTLGHAIESLAGYGQLPHGMAVAEGMRFAARLAERLTGASSELTERTGGLLAAIGAGHDDCAPLVAPLVAATDTTSVLAAMKSDKKSRGGGVRFVLLRSPGDWVVTGVDDETLLEELDSWAAGYAEGGE